MSGPAEQASGWLPSLAVAARCRWLALWAAVVQKFVQTLCVRVVVQYSKSQ
jgi:hypothetical protein